MRTNAAARVPTIEPMVLIVYSPGPQADGEGGRHPHDRARDEEQAERSEERIELRTEVRPGYGVQDRRGEHRDRHGQQAGQEDDSGEQVRRRVAVRQTAAARVRWKSRLTM